MHVVLFGLLAGLSSKCNWGSKKMRLMSNSLIALKMMRFGINRTIFDQSECWKYHWFQNDCNKYIYQ